MANKADKQCHFSVLANRLMAQKGMTQAMLSEATYISKSTISKMCYGFRYAPSVNTVMQISIGLKLSYDEFIKLLSAAFPQFEFMPTILDKHLNIIAADEFLYDNGIELFNPTQD